MFRRTHRHHGARRGRPSRFWTTARRATLAEIVAAENQRTATAALMRPRPRLARGLCRSRVHRQLRTSPRVAGQMQREPFGTPRVPKRLYFHLNSCQYGSFERQLGPAGFLEFCQPRCVSPTYAPGASRLLLGLLVAGQLLLLAKQANFGHLLGTGPLMMVVLRYYSHGVRGTQQGPHLLSFTPPAPSAPLRRLRRRSGACGAGFFLFFSSFFLFFWSLPA